MVATAFDNVIAKSSTIDEEIARLDAESQKIDDFTGPLKDWQPVVNENGEFAITPQFDMAYTFHAGIARVRVGDEYWLIDRSGKPFLKMARAGWISDCRDGIGEYTPEMWAIARELCGKYPTRMGSLRVNGNLAVLETGNSLDLVENAFYFRSTVDRNKFFTFHDSLQVSH